MALALRRRWGTLAGAGPPVCFDRVPRAQANRQPRPYSRLADHRPIALVAQRQDEYAMREPVRLSGRWPEPGGGEASPSSDTLSLARGSNLLREPCGDAAGTVRPDWAGRSDRRASTRPDDARRTRRP